MADRDLRIRVLLSKVGDLVAPLRGIGTQAAKTGAALKATQAQVKALKAAQADVASFRGLKTNLRGTESELAKAQDRVAGLAREISATAAPTKKLSAEFANAKKYAAALKTQHAEQAKKLQELRARLGGAGISTADLARHERTLRGDLVRANEQLEAQRRRLAELGAQERRLAGARRRFAQTQATAQRLATGGLATAGTGIAVLAPFKAAVDEAGRYESIMTSIGQKANMSRAATRRLGVDLASLAPKVNQLPEALAAGADTLTGFGLSARASTILLAPIGRAATAYQAEISDLARASFAVVDNLKVPFAGTGRAIDIMAEAGKRGAFELKDMAQYFPALTAAAQGLGQTGAPAVADLAAALQITRKGAGDAGTAANNLQNLLAKITAPGTVKKFDKMGVDLLGGLKRAAKEGKTPIEAIAELTNKTLGGDMSKLGNLFEDMQVQQALRPLIANIGLYREIRAAALKANGTVERDFVERMGDSAQITAKLAASTQSLQIKIGTLLAPAAAALTQRLVGLIDKLQAFADANPRLAKWLTIGAVATGVLMVVLGGLAIAVAGILGPFAVLRLALAGGVPGLVLAGRAVMWVAQLFPMLGAAIVRFLPAIWSFTAALLANPLTWIVLAVAGVIALAAAIYNHWGAIKAFVANLWTTLKQGVFDALLWFARLNVRFAIIGAQIVQGIIDGLRNKLAALKDTVLGAARSVATWFKNALGIRSPSRVFAGYGQHLMAGLSGGIDGGRDGPLSRISKLSRDMTAALAIGASVASPAAAAGGNGGGGGTPAGAPLAGNVYNFTINALPGQSPKDIAKAIRDELDKRDRQRAAAGRSTLADTGD